MPSGEGLVTAPASGRHSGVPGERYADLPAGEARRLAEHIPGPPRSIFRGRTRGDERRLMVDRESLICFDLELDAALGMEDEATLDEALMANAGVSIEMPTGKIKDLSNAC